MSQLEKLLDVNTLSRFHGWALNWSSQSIIGKTNNMMG